jgi:hypothetical protein
VVDAQNSPPLHPLDRERPLGRLLAIAQPIVDAVTPHTSAASGTAISTGSQSVGEASLGEGASRASSE